MSYPMTLSGGGRGLLLPLRDHRPLGPLFAQDAARCAERFFALGPSLSPGARRAHTLAVTALRRALQENRRAALGVMTSPSIATALRCADLRDALPAFQAHIDASAERTVPHVLLELGLRGLLAPGFAIDWSVGAPPLASPSLGVEVVPPPGATAYRFEADVLVALAGSQAVGTFPYRDPSRADGFTLDPAYHPLATVTRFAERDHNPIAAFEAHPDKQGNRLDLGGQSREAWRASLGAALDVIARHLAEVYAEMGLLLHEMVPVGSDPERHLSASYREAIGTVYLTLHPNVMTMAEAIVHEFQHNKLNLASYAEDFLVNAFEPLYPSPVRPDPRPLWGILLAAHAFLPVAVMYRRMRAAGDEIWARPDTAHRLDAIDLKNHEAVSMLRAHAVWTPAGRALMDEIEALDQLHMDERAAAGRTSEPTEAHPG